MESERFDRLIGSLGRVQSRRGALHIVAATFGLAGLSLLGLQDTSARKHKKHKKRRGNASPPTSPPPPPTTVQPVDQCPAASICNTAPNVCGTAATGEECSCELSTEGNNVCVNSGVGCPAVLRECTSTDGPEPTSCRNLAGFHFFCQEVKTNGAGVKCGCGQSLTTGRVCMPECDNPNP
jgi:hypothetical protein